MRCKIIGIVNYFFRILYAVGWSILPGFQYQKQIEDIRMRHVPVDFIAKQIGVSCDANGQISGYQADSRCVEVGNLFFALQGEKVDGHQFLRDVYMRGGMGAVVAKEYAGPDFGLILLRVENVLESLHALARADLRESKAQVVGVTGSVGKTTTKEFIAELLQAKYRVGKTPSNHNTKITMPLSILNRYGEEEVFVLEMGMSEPGDIRRLIDIAPPDIAVVTKIALAHAANFPEGLCAIAREKAEIFSNTKLRSAIYDYDLLQFPEALSCTLPEKISFSLEHSCSDYFLSYANAQYFVDERGVRAYQLQLPFNAKHLLHNFLAAATVARQMGLDWDAINSRIPYLHVPKMRFEVFEKEQVTYVNDAYNANPASMRAALEALPVPKEGGKRIGVLGVMSPLGSFSESAHREVGCAAQKTLDYLLVLGTEAIPLLESFQEVKKPAELFTDLPALTQRLQQIVSPGDVVLVKGSRIMQMDKIFESIPR